MNIINISNFCITDSTLVVGADIAKKIHVARAMDFHGIELGKDCVFHNDQGGLTKLATWMKELGQANSKTDIHCAIKTIYPQFWMQIDPRLCSRLRSNRKSVYGLHSPSVLLKLSMLKIKRENR